MKRFTLIITILGLLLSLLLAFVPAARAAGSFGYYLIATIDATNIDATLTDFPMFLDISGVAGLATTANGGNVQNTVATGGVSNSETIPADFDICTTLACTVTLDYEWIFYNPVNGRSMLYVEIPSISSSTDTDIYILYGDSGTTTDTENVTGVWSNDYTAVYHLDEYSGTRYDSAGSNDLTDNNTVTATTGKMDDAAYFTAANSEYLSSSDTADLSLDGGAFHVTFWRNRVDSSTTYGYLGKYDTGTNQREYRFYGAAYLSGQIDNNGTTPVTSLNSTNYWNDTDTWLFAAYWLTGTSGTFYVQGNDDAATSVSYVGDVLDGTSDFMVGSNVGYMDGALDEIRIAKGTARSDAWRKAQYINQDTPLTFYSLGTEQTQATPTPTATTAPTDTPTPTITNTPVPGATDTPTPTITNTPVPGATDTPVPGPAATAPGKLVNLNDDVLFLGYEITIGDVAVVVVLLMIATFVLIYVIFSITTHYLK